MDLRRPFQVGHHAPAVALRFLALRRDHGHQHGGQPNQLVARGVESGSSWKLKHPFIRPAVTRSRKKAEAKMAEILDQEIEKIMK